VGGEVMWRIASSHALPRILGPPPPGTTACGRRTISSRLFYLCRSQPSPTGQNGKVMPFSDKDTTPTPSLPRGAKYRGAVVEVRSDGLGGSYRPRIQSNGDGQLRS
jgi:hypothetical protein